jgi:heme exporter protein A
MGLARHFGDREIFRNVNLTAAPGAPIAITGPNGSGKSTLLEILAGLRLPSEGSLAYTYGGALSDKPPAGMLGFMSPRLRLYGELTAWEMMEFAAGGKDALERARALLEQAYLGEHRHTRTDRFSTGMLQRLKFITAVLNDPPTLLLDEPCSNLDEAGRDFIFTHLSSVRNEKAIIIATNDAREADFCAGRVDLA